MPVTDVSHDLDTLALTVVAEFAAPPERIWRLWSDPRQTGRWWGPPEWPASFIRHDFREGGSAFYEMTGPDGEKSRGWWEIISLEPPNRLVFRDGWANEDGSPAGMGVEAGARASLGQIDAILAAEG